MVGTDSIADLRFLLELLREFHSQEGVRQLRLLFGNLADIMEQTGPLGQFRIEPELGSHYRTDICDFPGVLEQVLPV